MRQHRRHQPLAQSPSALFFDNEDIRQPGERGEVRNDARKTDLASGALHAEAKRMFD
jgi:hypothetical protein